MFPSATPTGIPNQFPTTLPTRSPSFNPTIVPTNSPTNKPSLAPIALTGATNNTSALNIVTIIVIAVIGGLALICTLLLIRYRYREAETVIGEMNEWIEDAKTNKNHSSYIQLQHSSKQAKPEDPLLLDVHGNNNKSEEMI